MPHSVTTLIHFLIRLPFAEPLLNHRNWARLWRGQSGKERPLGRVHLLAGERARTQLERNLIVKDRGTDSVLQSLCRRAPWLTPRAEAWTSGYPCPTALCIAKDDMATACEWCPVFAHTLWAEADADMKSLASAPVSANYLWPTPGQLHSAKQHYARILIRNPRPGLLNIRRCLGPLTTKTKKRGRISS